MSHGLIALVRLGFAPVHYFFHETNIPEYNKRTRNRPYETTWFSIETALSEAITARQEKSFSLLNRSEIGPASRRR